ncbi:hypothetical protein GCM10009830_44400 [Glycomyces endophyticus]|uniref:Uncharacterized protein n=1 Tax=Glycomyces endophyticus TaxID=480996 RepID=A0ABN2HQH2_9ACTN
MEGVVVGAGVDRGGEAAEEVFEHVVVAHEVGDHGRELGVGGGDLGEEAAVLALVVAAEGGAEAAAVDEEVGADLLELAVDRAAGQVEGPAEALVDGAQLGAERDQAVGL